MVRGFLRLWTSAFFRLYCPFHSVFCRNASFPFALLRAELYSSGEIGLVRRMCRVPDNFHGGRARSARPQMAAPPPVVLARCDCWDRFTAARLAHGRLGCCALVHGHDSLCPVVLDELLPRMRPSNSDR